MDNINHTNLPEQVKLAIEQIYENESLTSNCTDENAKQLLTWGKAQLTEIGKIGECDPETFDQYLNQLQHTMRTVNHLIGKQVELSEEDFVEQLLQLLDRVLKLSTIKIEIQDLGGNFEAKDPDLTGF